MAVKEYKGEYYIINSIMGCEWAMFILLLGGRESGKSYSAMEWIVNRKEKHGDKTKVFWMRLTEEQAKKLKRGNGKGMVDPDILRRHKIKTFYKNGTIYTYTPELNEEGIEVKTNVKELAEVLACSTFYQDKGVASYDADFEKTPGTEYIFILDEFEKEEGEKSQGDVLYQFVNAIHNKCRSAKNVKVIMCGNTLSETSDILAAFNFIPMTWGRYKLKSKKCVIDYIKPTKKYLERQKGSVSDILLKNASTFTNKNDADMISADILVNKRKCFRPSTIIMFGKDTKDWYTLWNDGIIRAYNKETLNNVVAMKRYLNAVYSQELVNNVIERFDAMAFKFTELATFLRFQSNLKMIKKK